jgi:hypothetical protein
VAELADALDSKASVYPRDTFALSYGCEHERTVMTQNDCGTVNTLSTAARTPGNRLRGKFTQLVCYDRTCCSRPCGKVFTRFFEGPGEIRCVPATHPAVSRTGRELIAQGHFLRLRQ